MLTKTNDVVRISEVKLGFCEVWLGEDGICRVVLMPGVMVGLAEMKENLAAQWSVIGSGKAPALVDMRDINASTQGAREFTAGEEYAQAVSAVAILENTTIGKILGNLFINFSKPIYPTRLFTSESQAIEWLKQFVETSTLSAALPVEN